MKLCNNCKVIKPLTEFSFQNKSKNQYATFCKKCHSEKYDIPRYKVNPKFFKEKNTAYKNETRRKYFEYIKTLKCENCGFNDWRCLEFNHRDPATKYKNVSDMVARHSFENVLKEISKCSVLCANCHRIETCKQRGWFSDFNRVEEESNPLVLETRDTRGST